MSFFISLFQMLVKVKGIRVILTFALVLAVLNTLNTYVLSTFANFVMPDAMLKLWNFFSMNDCISVVISAYETKIITKLVIRFASAYLSG
jgi:hypothetical protein